MHFFSSADRQGSSPQAWTVLLIEDDQAFRRVLQRTFTEAGFQISEAATGKDALEALTKSPPDSVVLDLGLPDGLSRSVLEHLRGLERDGKDPPVWIVTSALDMEEAVRRYGPFGSHYLAKPFDPWNLVDTLTASLSLD